MEAAIGICIFIEDRSNYVKAMNKFLDRVPAYIYLTSDGEHPKTAPSSGLTSLAAITNYWYGQDTFPVSGIAQETCRDFVHVGYGLASISHVAESSRIQGNDLYTGDIGQRLRFGLGFHSSYQLGGSVPSWLCKGSLVDTGSKRLNSGKQYYPIKTGQDWLIRSISVTEVGYNALSTRLGIAMDNTGILTMSQRPAGENELFVGWETLTHGNNTA